MNGLLVSTLARAAGVHPETVRRLERKGLIKSWRDVNGWRRYPASAVDTLKRLYGVDGESSEEMGYKKVGGR
jgi:DNA-binding transcriptional MerR regulator